MASLLTRGSIRVTRLDPDGHPTPGWVMVDSAEVSMHADFDEKAVATDVLAMVDAFRFQNKVFNVTLQAPRTTYRAICRAFNLPERHDAPTTWLRPHKPPRRRR